MILKYTVDSSRAYVIHNSLCDFRTRQLNNQDER
jgi:hypothetical protein